MCGEVCPLSYLTKSPIDACESLRVPANFQRSRVLLDEGLLGYLPLFSGLHAGETYSSPT